MIKEHLTEKLMKLFLEDHFKDIQIIHNKTLKINDLSFRPDFYLPEINLIVEFNGYYHYQDTSTIIKDYQKRQVLSTNNIHMIEIPYFIQFNTKEIIQKYFGNYLENPRPFNVYPNGFHNSKALLPSNFCHDGVLRFMSDLDFLGNDIRCEIMDSLESIYQKRLNKMKSYQSEFDIRKTVFPYTLLTPK